MLMEFFAAAIASIGIIKNESAETKKNALDVSELVFITVTPLSAPYGAQILYIKKCSKTGGGV